MSLPQNPACPQKERFDIRQNEKERLLVQSRPSSLK